MKNISLVSFSSCTQCDKKFTHRSTFKLHVSMHQGNQPYKCHVCSKSFIQSSNYHRHIDTHRKKEERMQKCELCGKELVSTRGIRKHRLMCVKRTVERANSHLAARKTSRPRLRGEFRCEHCPRVFTYSRRLEAHVTKKHPPSSENSSTKPSAVAKSDHDCRNSRKQNKRGEFRCEHCPKIFVYNRRLEAHIKQKHSSSSVESSTQAKTRRQFLKIQCSACGRRFGHKHRLREHQIKDHQQLAFQGTLCEQLCLIRAGGGGGEVSPRKKWVGVCVPLPKTLTLFQTKICDFPYLPCFRPDQKDFVPYFS